MGWKAVLGGTSVAVLVLLTGMPAGAEGWDNRNNDCRDRIERAEIKLDRAVNRWGPRGYEAMDARRNLQRVRQWCWSRNNGWWDMHSRTWHTNHW